MIISDFPFIYKDFVNELNANLYRFIGYEKDNEYWFDNNIDDCIKFFEEKILEDNFMYNYNNLYVAYDSTSNKIVGVICAIDIVVDRCGNADYIDTVSRKRPGTPEGSVATNCDDAVQT